MGASPSRTSYEYSYGDSYAPSGYARSKNMLSPLSSFTPSGLGTRRNSMQPYPQYPMSPNPMGYQYQQGAPPMPMPMQQQQRAFPLVMQPMHLLSNGTPNLLNQPQPQLPLHTGSQPHPQAHEGPRSQMPFSPGPASQMPQPPPQMPEPFAGGGPPMQQAPSQMPQPQVPFSPVPPHRTQQYPSQMPEPQVPFSPGSASGMPQPQRSFSPPNEPMPQPPARGRATPYPSMSAPPVFTPFPQPQAPLSPLPPPMQPSASGMPPGFMPDPAFPFSNRMPSDRSPYLQQQGPEGPFVPIMRSPGPEAGPDRAMPVVPPSLTRSSSSTGTSDPLSRNPLPDPPMESQIPPELVRDTAVATLGPRGPGRSRTPLPHPLPELPRDVYLKRKYRPLLVGTAYGREKEVYPQGWFADENGRDAAEAGLVGAFARLNPFRPQDSGSEDDPARFGHRRNATMPEFADFVRNGPPMEGSVSGGSSASSTRRWRRLNPFSLLSPFNRRRRTAEAAAQAQAQATGQWPPPSGFMPYQTPMVPPGQEAMVPPYFPPSQEPMMPPLVAAQGPSSPTPAATAPSPGAPPSVRFNMGIPEYAGLCHTSPHSVFYKDRLYPSAAHLFEALKFLGRRDDIAERLREAEDLSQLAALVTQNRQHIRRDWEQVAMRKMEDVLYRKFVQHPDLMARLLKTGIAELIYAEANDSFWGEGPAGQGANELGYALMRVRERLQNETTEYENSDAMGSDRYLMS